MTTNTNTNMRERITFLQRPEDAVDPASIAVTGTSLTGPPLSAAREDRITLALEELPEELRQVLQSCHELHIRWVGPHPYDSVNPLYSRLSPGLHVFFTPRADSTFQDHDQLCVALKTAFGSLDCDTPKDSFTSLPSDRFSHSTAFQYYQPLEDLSVFTNYLGRDVCPSSSSGTSSCAPRAELLSTANSLDISYDTISHALKVTGTWGFQEQQPLQVVAPEATNHRVEVGILATDKPHGIEPHELGLSGSLTVLGQDKKPAATIFKFPARHRRVEGASFSAAFLQPTGLHPTLQLRLHGASSASPPDLGGDGDDEGHSSSHCSLHAHLTLPRTVFADKYQLSDPLFLSSKNLTALRYISQPVDLEAPDYTLKPWGSAALLELAPPPPTTSGERDWTAEVPLHLRYMSPAPGGYRTAQVPHPAVFWACTTEEGTKFPASPFERVNLGYDGLFGPRTVFWHVDPAAADGAAELLSELRVPVLDVDKSAWVSAGTAAVVLLGFGWVAWKLLSVYLRTGYGPQQQMEGLEKKEQ